MNYKKGDLVKITDGLGKVMEAVFLRLDYKGKVKIYAVEVRMPVANSKKSGHRTTTWYLPETRFVK